MPTCCHFKDRKSNEVVTLTKLDEILCEILKITPHERKMCWLYDSICMVGFAILSKSQGGTITKEDFDSYMETRSDDFDKENKELLERFLVTDYEFAAWYQLR
jgi:hypothetical protein